MVIFAIICYHGNSLQYTHMNENGIPGVCLIFTVNARSLNPKLKQILHFRFVIFFQEQILLKLQGATLSHHTRPLGNHTRQTSPKHLRKLNQMDRLVITLPLPRRCTTPIQQNHHGNLKRNYQRSQRNSFAGNSPMTKYVKSLTITVFHQLIV